MALSELEIQQIKRFSVSSTLKDLKASNKNCLFDGLEETCWNSAEGSPQWIKVQFHQKRTITSVQIQFQGGFAGKSCYFHFGDDVTSEKESFFPEDNNTIQTFTIKNPLPSSWISIMFSSSTDFFGRIVVYSLKFKFAD